MIRRVRFEAEADAEFTEAVRWLERQRAGFGEALFDAVEATIERICEHPRAGAPGSTRQADLRRLLVPRFPYQIVYYLKGREVVVVAVAHTSRRPGYWKGRL